jgi:hypothetical protein
LQGLIAQEVDAASETSSKVKVGVVVCGPGCRCDDVRDMVARFGRLTSRTWSSNLRSRRSVGERLQEMHKVHEAFHTVGDKELKPAPRRLFDSLMMESLEASLRNTGFGFRAIDRNLKQAAPAPGETAWILDLDLGPAHAGASCDLFFMCKGLERLINLYSRNSPSLSSVAQPSRH